MESYVEVAFLHNWMSTLLSVWMALFVIQRPLRGRRVLLYSALASLYSSLAFFDHAWIGAAGIELLAFLFVFYRQKALYLVSLLFRALWHATCFIFWEGSFHLGAFFPWVHTPIYLCWLLYGLLFLYLYTHAMTLMKQKFRYGCTLCGKGRPLHLWGYMDSGNLLTHQGLAVLFLDEAYRAQLQGTTCRICVGSIHGKREMEALRLWCALDGGARQQVYVVFVDGLRIRGGYRLLLNLKLLSMR